MRFFYYLVFIPVGVGVLIGLPLMLWNALRLDILIPLGLILSVAFIFRYFFGQPE